MDRTDLHCEEKQDDTSLSPTFWQKPHSEFVKILIGAKEVAFSIQQDIISSRSPHFWEQLVIMNKPEHVYKLNTDVEAFGCFQSFIYTGQVKSGDSIPEFSILLRAWKLAKLLKVPRLQMRLLECMIIRHDQMRCMPSAQDIEDVWEDTEVGCPLRIKLIDWMIEHLGDGHEDTKFAEHLRKEILSELCMVMARSSVNPTPNRAKVRPPKKRERNHGLNDDAYEPDISSSEERAPKRRGCVGAVNRDLNFCRDLIHRMLSHGYWARFVGPFKKPVDPDLERIPDYFKVIKRPIDLSTIKRKMDGDAYINAKGFEEDIRQMFQNCYTYWTETDAMFKFCKGFEKAFDKEWVKIKTNPLLGGSEEPEL